MILALAGITFFLTEHLRITSLRQNQTKAIYLAQAGIMRAIYDFRYDDPTITGTDNGFQLGEYSVQTGALGSFPNDDVFILSGVAADFLLAAMIPGTWTPGNMCPPNPNNRQILQNWTLRNVLLMNTPPDGLPVAIHQLQVSWQPNNGELVYRVDLMGTGADWSSCTGAASGDLITLTPDQTVAPSDRPHCG